MAETRSSDPRGVLRAFALTSLACVGVGCWVAAAHDVPAAIWVRNLVAWAAGLGMAALVSRTAGTLGARAGFLLAAPAGLIVSLFSPGLSGVHRWTQLGPVRVNLAEILLPAAVVALAALSPGRGWTWLAAAAIAGLLVAQPDASQATAFGGAVMTLLLFSPLRRGPRGLAGAAVVVVVVAAWLRPDPLAPVPEVEEIFRLAATLSPFVALLAGAALAAAALTPMLAGRQGGSALTSASAALAVYFLLSAITPALGAFPVPLVGMGMSPILGFWLGVGMLAAMAPVRRTSSPSP